MNRLAPSPSRPINWPAWIASGTVVPPRAVPRDRLAAAWLVMLLIGGACLAIAAELGTFQ